jgi:drug/metabolite transporter (DMT)-like permease
MILFVVFIWGMNVIALKVLVHHFSPVTMTAFRIFTAGAAVLLFLSLQGAIRRLSLEDAKRIFIIGLFNVVGHHIFLSIGLTMTTASNAALILGLSPLCTALLAALMLKERFTWTRALGVFFGFLGVTFIIVNGSGQLGSASLGDFFIFLSMFVQAISFIMIKQVQGTLDARVLTGWMLVNGAVVMFLFALFYEPHGLATLAGGNLFVWSLFFGSAIFATGLGHMLYNKAIQSLGPAETSIFINFSPFFSLLGSWLFLGEDISMFQMVGFVFFVLGVLFGAGVVDHLKMKKKDSAPLPDKVMDT